MLPSPYGVLILLTMAENNCSVTQAQVAVPLRGSYLINSYGNAYSKMIPVAVPLRGSYLINLTEPFFTWKIRVAVPLRGSYLINPVLYSPPFVLTPNPFCVAKPFSAHFLTQKNQKPPATPLKSSCVGKHI